MHLEKQANLSLWIRTPLSPLSPIQIWSYQSNMSIYSSASFNGSVLGPIVNTPGDYSIIFQFQHWVQNSGNITINLSNLQFWLDYAARDFYPNESISISQNWVLNRNPIIPLWVSFQGDIQAPNASINESEVLLVVDVANSSIVLGSLQNLTLNQWVQYNFALPLSINTQGNCSLSLQWIFDASNITRFADNDSWSWYFDNISLWANIIPLFDDFNLTLDTSLLNNYNVSLQILPDMFNETQIDSLQIINNNNYWFPGDSCILRFILQNNSFPISFQGNFTVQGISWRDYLFLQSESIYSGLNQYFTTLQNKLLQPDIGWEYLLALSTLIPYLQQPDYSWLLYQGLQLNGWFGRPFTSYILYEESNPNYKPHQLYSLLYSCTGYINKSNSNQGIQNLIISGWNDYPSIIEDQRQALYLQLNQSSEATMPGYLDFRYDSIRF